MKNRWIVASVALSFLLGICCAGLIASSSWSNFYKPDVKTIVVVEPRGWQLRSQHLVYGLPQLVDSRYDFVPEGEAQTVAGVSLLVREGFVIGHCDRYKVPLWVSMRWSKYDLAATEGKKSPERSFHEDLELPHYARATSTYKGQGRWDRGHMARNLDNLSWGEDNARQGCLMSNIVPQSPHLNEVVWNALEDEHRKIVSRGKIDTIWIICGSIFREGQPEVLLNNGVGVPKECYKVIAWFDKKRQFHARAYLYPQDATDKNPLLYLASVDEVERLTGIDFFPELERETQEGLESSTFQTLWE